MGTLTTGFPLILSQNQSFDCLPLLTALELGKKATVGMTGLARNGHLQVRLYEPVLAKPPRSEIAKFSAINALCSALARPDFVYSAWPELDDDPDRRSCLLECLAKIPLQEAPRKIATALDERTANRIAGLIELDRAIAQSKLPSRALGAPKKSLREYVIDHLEKLQLRKGDAYRAVSTKLIGRGRDTSIKLNDRSQWLRLLDELAAEYGPYMHDQIDAAKEIVHSSYNRVMSESVLASGRETSTGFKVVVDALEQYDDTSSAVPRVVALATEKKRESWLTWEKASELMEGMSSLPLPPRRADYLVSERCDLLIDRTADFISTCIAVPTGVVTTGLAPDVADASLGESLAWGLGTAVVSWAASQTAARRVGKRMIGSRLSSRTKKLSEASVSRGTAKWEDLITRVTGEKIH